MSAPILEIPKPSIAEELNRSRALLQRMDKFGVEAVADQEKVHASSLYRLRVRAREGKPLFDRRRLNQGAASKVDSQRLGWAVALMAARPRIALAAVCRELNKVALLQGWPQTHYQALKRAVKNMPADLRALLAEDAKSAFEKTAVVGKREQTRPLELVQLDATEVPVWTIHPATGALTRPWATGIIDGYSRMLLGFELHLAEPTALVTAATLTDAILPKDDATWPAFGLPETLQTDNAREYIGEVMSAIAVRAEFVLDQVPVDCPSANGKIERWFGTFETRFLTSLAGYASFPKAMKAAKQHGVVPFEVMKSVARRAILEYHSSVHSELGMTPWEAWHEKIHEAPGYFIPPAELREKLRVEIEAKVDREGVTVLGTQYAGKCLTGMFDKTVSILTSARGGDQSVDAYEKGRFIGRLRPRCFVGDELNEARGPRMEALERFKAKVRKKLDVTPQAGGPGTVIPKEERNRIQSGNTKPKERRTREVPELGTE